MSNNGVVLAALRDELKADKVREESEVDHMHPRHALRLLAEIPVHAAADTVRMVLRAVMWGQVLALLFFFAAVLIGARELLVLAGPAIVDVLGIGSAFVDAARAIVIDGIIGAINWVLKYLLFGALGTIPTDWWPYWMLPPSLPFTTGTPWADLEVIVTIDPTCNAYVIPYNVLAFVIRWASHNAACPLVRLALGNPYLEPLVAWATLWIWPDAAPGRGSCAFGDTERICGVLGFGFLLLAVIGLLVVFVIVDTYWNTLHAFARFITWAVLFFPRAFKLMRVLGHMEQLRYAIQVIDDVHATAGMPRPGIMYPASAAHPLALHYNHAAYLAAEKRAQDATHARNAAEIARHAYRNREKGVSSVASLLAARGSPAPP